MSDTSTFAAAPVFLAAGELEGWLRKQAESRMVLAPVKEGHAFVFRPLQPGDVPALERTRISPKAAIMPTGETLMRFSAVKDEEDPGKLHVSLEDKAGADVGETLIFACRSCDARGFLALDKAYLEGPYKDPYYAVRREKTAIMVMACNEPCPTCFCHWVGGGPDSFEGADVRFTVVEGGYVLTAHTEKGKALIQGLPAAEAAMTEAADAAHARARESLPEAPDLSHSAERVAARFDAIEFWQDETAKCLACGACTYMCPTCQCFTITDEGDVSRGKRLRSWDSCMSSRFTLEASGHNPRTRKAARMRQRVSHKYCYSLRNNEIFSCTGCGRCVRYCPVALDIREIVLKANEEPKA